MRGGRGAASSAPTGGRSLLRGGGFFLFFGNFFSGALLGLLFFLFQFGADELDDGKFRSIADAPTRANDARVAARAVGKARREIIEEFFRGANGHQESGGLAARVERIALAERDHAFGERTRSLRAKQRRLNSFLFDEIRDEIPQRGATVGRLSAEFRSRFKVSHVFFPKVELHSVGRAKAEKQIPLCAADSPNNTD